MKRQLSELWAGILVTYYETFQGYENIQVTFKFIKPNGFWAFELCTWNFNKNEIIYKNY